VGLPLADEERSRAVVSAASDVLASFDHDRDEEKAFHSWQRVLTDYQASCETAVRMKATFEEVGELLINMVSSSVTNDGDIACPLMLLPCAMELVSVACRSQGRVDNSMRALLAEFSRTCSEFASFGSPECGVSVTESLASRWLRIGFLSILNKTCVDFLEHKVAKEYFPLQWTCALVVDAITILNVGRSRHTCSEEFGNLNGFKTIASSLRGGEFPNMAKVCRTNASKFDEVIPVIIVGTIPAKNFKIH
jgi:hypothetical protein